MHPRATIRQAFVEQLSTPIDNVYPTMAETRVYASRVKPLFDQFLPAILVYTQSETVEENQYNGDGYAALKRQLSVEIEAVIKGTEALDDELDQFALQIETALDGWDIPLRCADIVCLEKTESSIVMEGAKYYGVTRLSYRVTYRTAVKQGI